MCYDILFTFRETENMKLYKVKHNTGSEEIAVVYGCKKQIIENIKQNFVSMYKPRQIIVWFLSKLISIISLYLFHRPNTLLLL